MSAGAGVPPRKGPQTVVREVGVPLGWRLGAHGDPIAVFGPEAVVVLELHADGTVTWRDDG